MLNIWRRQHWIDLAFNLVRDWGLCCCLLLHILCLLVHKLITVFSSHLPSHHRVTAINRSTLLMPDFMWILRILPQILLRQVLFSVSLLCTSIYSLTFPEFHIFLHFFLIVAGLPIDFWVIKIGCSIMNNSLSLFLYSISLRVPNLFFEPPWAPVDWFSGLCSHGVPDPSGEKSDLNLNFWVVS